MQLGHVDAGAQSTGKTDRRAYDLITEGFGPGANGPLTVVTHLDSRQVAGRSGRQDLATTLQHTLAAVPGVASVTPPAPSPDHDLLITTVTPTTGPQEQATTRLDPHTAERHGAAGAVAAPVPPATSPAPPPPRRPSPTPSSPNCP